MALSGLKTMVMGSLPDMSGPLGMTNSDIGGVAQGNQPGVIDGKGPCNQGQWARVWGRVVFVSPNAHYFVINDGSNVPFEPFQQVYGIKVYRPDAAMPGYGEFVTVSGAVWLYWDPTDPSKLRPMLWELPAMQYTTATPGAPSKSVGASSALGK